MTDQPFYLNMDTLGSLIQGTQQFLSVQIWDG